MEIFIPILFITASTLVLSVGSAKLLTILQQSGYQVGGLFSWLKQSHFSSLIRYVSLAFISTCSILLFNFCFPQENVHYFSIIIYFALSLMFIYLMFVPRAKVPLKLTPRMIRLILVNTVVCGSASVGAYFLSQTVVQESAYSVLPALTIGFVLLSHYIVYPLEKLIAHRFIKEASAEIEKRKAGGLKVVGITGSYGKTTAKNILGEMLSVKFKTCRGEGSFNTPLGLCRVINECLGDDDEILIAEMGARRVGDIAELCRIARPDIGLITAVGSQHLETFGSMENIADGKYELIGGLAGGIAAFNGDDSGAKALFDRCTLADKLLSGADNTCDVTYTDVKFGSFGCKFTLIHGKEKAQVGTKLLGEYVPSLISLCAAVALKLGVSLSGCAKACASLEPVPHRLELISNGDTYIIDDSYNANTKGALAALKVLGGFDCRKIIVTPGLVELGKDEKQANKAFGGQIAQYADTAILIGGRSVQMKAGAAESGMLESNIVCVKSLDEAKQVFAEIIGEKVVLFENDLTDSYC